METIDDSDQGDVLDRTCPTRKTLDLISSVWTVLVLHVLSEKVCRYTEIRDRIDGITPKMLSQTLRYLERDGIVTRKMYPVVPPRVEYSLTDLGRTLVPILNQLCDWSNNNYHKVQTARLSFAKEMVYAGTS